MQVEVQRADEPAAPAASGAPTSDERAARPREERLVHAAEVRALPCARHARLGCRRAALGVVTARPRVCEQLGQLVPAGRAG
eukprot:1086305-Prymnesium_polylepis.1